MPKINRNAKKSSHLDLFRATGIVEAERFWISRQIASAKAAPSNEVVCCVGDVIVVVHDTFSICRSSNAAIPMRVIAGVTDPTEAAQRYVRSFIGA
jgi:hypothetical protein